jgi:hypothetical protein
MKGLYDDFMKHYEELQEELVRDKIDRVDEMALFKYIFLIQSYIRALNAEGKLIFINNKEQNIPFNKKANQAYLENFSRRK